MRKNLEKQKNFIKNSFFDYRITKIVLQHN